MADNEYKPEEEGSLDEFEKDVIANEKKKSKRNVAISAVLLVVLAGAGYYLYSAMFGGSEAPPPAIVAPKLALTPESPPAAPGAPVKPGATPAAPVKPSAAPATPVKQAAAPAKPGATPAAPAKKTAVTETKAVAGKTEAAKPAPSVPGTSTLQLGVFIEKANAEELIKRVEKLGFTPETLEKMVNVKNIGIYTGYYRYRELAIEGSKKLTQNGFENKVVLKGPGNYSVEVGTYKTDKAADVVVKKLNANGYKVDVDYTTVKKPARVVLLRNIESADRLKEITAALAADKIDFLVIRKK